MEYISASTLRRREFCCDLVFDLLVRSSQGSGVDVSVENEVAGVALTEISNVETGFYFEGVKSSKTCIDEMWNEGADIAV